MYKRQSAVQYFAKRLNRSQAVASKTSSYVEMSAAVNIENNESVLLLNSKPKSLLKKLSTNNCDKCLNTDFHSLDDLQHHFEIAHHNAIEIRDISIREESAVKIQDGASDVDDENVEHGFKCQFCDSILSNDQERIKHNNEIHVSTTETKLQCPTCLQHFKHLSSFKKHRSEHFKGNFTIIIYNQLVILLRYINWNFDEKC